jgi:hypothetical protein
MNNEQQGAVVGAFNRWVDANCALPAGHYTHDQLRMLLWLAWMAAIDLQFAPCGCGCGWLVPGGLMELAHPEDFRDERG